MKRAPLRTSACHGQSTTRTFEALGLQSAVERPCRFAARLQRSIPGTTSTLLLPCAPPRADHVGPVAPNTSGTAHSARCPVAALGCCTGAPVPSYRAAAAAAREARITALPAAAGTVAGVYLEASAVAAAVAAPAVAAGAVAAGAAPAGAAAAAAPLAAPAAAAAAVAVAAAPAAAALSTAGRTSPAAAGLADAGRTLPAPVPAAAESPAPAPAAAEVGALAAAESPAAARPSFSDAAARAAAFAALAALPAPAAARTFRDCAEVPPGT